MAAEKKISKPMKALILILVGLMCGKAVISWLTVYEMQSQRASTASRNGLPQDSKSTTIDVTKVDLEPIPYPPPRRWGEFMQEYKKGDITDSGEMCILRFLSAMSFHDNDIDYSLLKSFFAKGDSSNRINFVNALADGCVTSADNQKPFEFLKELLAETALTGKEIREVVRHSMYTVCREGINLKNNLQLIKFLHGFLNSDDKYKEDGGMLLDELRREYTITRIALQLSRVRGSNDYTETLALAHELCGSELDNYLKMYVSAGDEKK